MSSRDPDLREHYDTIPSLQAASLVSQVLMSDMVQVFSPLVGTRVILGVVCEVQFDV